MIVLCPVALRMERGADYVETLQADQENGLDADSAGDPHVPQADQRPHR